MAKKSKKEAEAELETEETDAEATEETEATEAETEVPAEPGAEGETAESPRKRRKEKKAVKKRKSKKEKENPLARAVRVAVETGKVEFGAKTGVKDALLGKAKLIVVSEKAPQTLKEDLNYYAKLSKIPVLVYEGTSMELGSICGKPHPVSVLSVYETGSSDILELVKK